MRLSCNGCRVLRKGCTQDCSLRACLDWIQSPESQANATVFLAKFYGRAGLMNLIESGPVDMRPAIFRSLLHDACGRILNPVYGSVGLLWSGNWQACADAVEAVLRGEEIVPQVENGGGGGGEKEPGSAPVTACGDIRRAGKGKVTGKRSKRAQVRAGSDEKERSPSRVESGLSQAETVSRTCKSLELDEPERPVREGLGSAQSGGDDVDGLELSLGFGVWSERKIRRVGPRSNVVSGDGQNGL